MVEYIVHFLNMSLGCVWMIVHNVIARQNRAFTTFNLHKTSYRSFITAQKWYIHTMYDDDPQVLCCIARSR